MQINSPRDAIGGIGFLTENRKEQGLFLELAAQENIVMATLERDASYGLLNRRKGQKIASEAIQSLNIRVPHAGARRRLIRRQPAEAADFALGIDSPAS